VKIGYRPWTLHPRHFRDFFASHCCQHLGGLVLFPDPNNPSVDRLQYLVQGRRVGGFDLG